MTKATIQERGNGLPVAGDFVPGDDGQLYRVVRLDGQIQTGNPGGGESNYVNAVVDLADWSDCDEGEDFPALAVLEASD